MKFSTSVELYMPRKTGYGANLKKIQDGRHEPVKQNRANCYHTNIQPIMMKIGFVVNFRMLKKMVNILVVKSNMAAILNITSKVISA